LKVGKERIDYYWIWTKDPSVQAFTDLMNRALGKPSEQVQITGRDKWRDGFQMARPGRTEARLARVDVGNCFEWNLGVWIAVLTGFD